MKRKTMALIVACFILLMAATAFAIGGDEPWDKKNPFGKIMNEIRELKQSVYGLEQKDQSLQRQIDSLRATCGCN